MRCNWDEGPSRVRRSRRFGSWFFRNPTRNPSRLNIASSSCDPTEADLYLKIAGETGQFLLQVDRQTKASYATYEAAQEAALVIKRGHPIVQVVVYDAVAGVKKIIELLES